MSEPVLKDRRDQRREAILEVAREVFTEEGYAAASMSTIAARLGGSKGTLYNYFKSKEELFGAYVREGAAGPKASSMSPRSRPWPSAWPASANGSWTI